jgi:chemotaxis signal transduction protein
MASFWLLDFNGDYAAVEAETGLDFIKSPTLTKLPLSGPLLAGLVLVDDQTLLVADLDAWLDLSPADSHADRSLFRFQGKNTGFLTAADIRLLETEDHLILPLPEIMEKSCLRGCLVVDGRAVLLVDLHQVQEKLSQEISHSKSSIIKNFPEFPKTNGTHWRLVHAAGGQSFALPACLFSPPLRPRPAVTATGRMPPGMIGVYNDGGKILPAWSLGALLDENLSPDENFLLTGGMAVAELAIMVEGEGEEISACPSLPLPPWGRRPGIESALLVGRDLVPCLQIDALLQGHRHEAEEEAPQLAILPQGAWEVTELQIAGTRHAVLKEEVAEVLQPLPWFRLPGLAPIVQGVAFWQDEIWPVVDLSCYFGGRLDSSTAGCMIALQRGPHRLLLLAEHFQGHRIITAEEQRFLPLKVPHSLVSGCYLSDDTVILLLDAPALVHHFEPSLVRNFRSLLSVDSEISLPSAPIVDIDSDGNGHEAAASSEIPREEVPAPSPGPADEVLPHHLHPEENIDSDGNGHQAAFSTPIPAPDNGFLAPETPVLTEEKGAESISELGGSGTNPREFFRKEAGRRLKFEKPAPGKRRSSSRQFPWPGENPKMFVLVTTAGVLLIIGLLTDWWHPRPAAEAPLHSPFSIANQQESADNLPERKPPETGTPNPMAVENSLHVPAPAPPGLPMMANTPPVRPGRQALEVEGLSGKTAENQAAPAPVNDGQMGLQDVPAEAISKAVQNTIAGAPLTEKLEFQDASKGAGEPHPTDSAKITTSTYAGIDESQPLPLPTADKNSYIIRKGDTLWDLSGRFFKDPGHYDELARENMITDPHWIYPGQILVIEMPPTISSTE